MEHDWGMFCLTVVHEIGHLLGPQAQPGPGSVMAPVFTSLAPTSPRSAIRRALGGLAGRAATASRLI